MNASTSSKLSAFFFSVSGSIFWSVSRRHTLFFYHPPTTPDVPSLPPIMTTCYCHICNGSEKFMSPNCTWAMTPWVKNVRLGWWWWWNLFIISTFFIFQIEVFCILNSIIVLWSCLKFYKCEQMYCFQNTEKSSEFTYSIITFWQAHVSGFCWRWQNQIYSFHRY